MRVSLHKSAAPGPRRNALSIQEIQQRDHLLGKNQSDAPVISQERRQQLRDEWEATVKGDTP